MTNLKKAENEHDLIKMQKELKELVIDIKDVNYMMEDIWRKISKFNSDIYQLFSKMGGENE